MIDFLKRVYFYFEGRYGVDEFTKFLIVTGLAFGVLNFFSDGQLFSLIGVGLIAYGGLRPMSKETKNRQKELGVYHRIKKRVMTMYKKIEHVINKMIDKIKSIFGRKKYTNYKEVKKPSTKIIVSCPNCGQKLRVPKNKKVNINCNNCHYQFTKQT